MNAKKPMFLAILGLLIMIIGFGCARYGKLRLQSGPGQRMTIHTLKENWQNYNVLYAGLNVNHPSAVIFDRKDDNTALVGDRWLKVEDKQTLSNIVDYIQTEVSRSNYYPRLWKVLGPEDQMYAYMFSSWDRAVMKVVNDNTLYVNDIPLPPSLAIFGRGESK
ncbi:MAG: hypothetical protein PVG99_04685 [Desulfobacteraceae bacterium]|jgi:hypothetical protein